MKIIYSKKWAKEINIALLGKHNYRIYGTLNCYISSIYFSIRARCRNLPGDLYRNYGRKGIQCRITKKEILNLWMRDKGFFLKRPSIDRIDSDWHYTVSNCRFIELSRNVKRAAKDYWKKKRAA